MQDILKGIKCFYIDCYCRICCYKRVNTCEIHFLYAFTSTLINAVYGALCHSLQMLNEKLDFNTFFNTSVGRRHGSRVTIIWRLRNSLRGENLVFPTQRNFLVSQNWLSVTQLRPREGLLPAMHKPLGWMELLIYATPLYKKGQLCVWPLVVSAPVRISSFWVTTLVFWARQLH